MLTLASQSMISTNATFMILACIAVILRVYTRVRKSPPLKADDYLIVGALVFSVFLAVTNIVGVPIGGFGVPFQSLSPEKSATFLKILFVLQFWYIIAVALVKLSVLYFYGRIFSVGRFPIAIRLFIALTVAWLISFLFATFFQVWPLWCNWITCNPSTNYPVMYVLSSVTDIILDICILCIPAWFIKHLQMSSSRKVGLAGIFGLGIFCIVSSIARLAYTILFVEVNIEGNYAVNFDTSVVNIIMWSGIEACASTICANLPCCGPLVAKAASIESIIKRVRSIFSTQRKTSYSTSSMPKRPWPEITSSTENIVDQPIGVKTTIVGGDAHEIQASDLEMGKINRHTTLKT